MSEEVPILTSAPDRGPDPMFPRLTQAQIARLFPFARERRFSDKESVWEAGDRNRPMFVVLEGGIEIRSGSKQLVTTHEPGGFSGDVDMLSRRPAVVGAQARGATRTLELSSDRVRSLVQTDAELSELFLRAFIPRRVALMAQSQGSAVLLGSRHCGVTLATQEFLTRNSIPYAYIDLDHETNVQATLDGFGVGPEDVPVVICR